MSLTLETQLFQALHSWSQLYPNAALASSLSKEDMVLTHAIASLALPIRIFTLDTGRLPSQTYDLLAEIGKHFPSLKLEVISPQAQDLQDYVHSFGINGFYESVPARQACCAARKVQPLKRALERADAWMTGLRKAQSESREALEASSVDALTGLPKFNPLLDWDDEAVDTYIQQHQVPINALHSQGYPSLGCQPCTRAVTPGEHPRAGRWWWEQQAVQECGLHADPSGKLVRAQPIAIQRKPSTTEVTL